MRHYIYGILSDGQTFQTYTDDLAGFLAAPPDTYHTIYVAGDDSQPTVRESCAHAQRQDMNVVVITPGEDVDIDAANQEMEKAAERLVKP